MNRSSLPALSKYLARRAVAALAILLCGPASAADPVRGALLFATAPARGQLACADCHSEDPVVNNFGNIFVGRNATGLIQRAIVTNTGGMGYFSSYYGINEMADIAAYLGNSPASLSFGNTPLGRSSAVQSVFIRASSKVDTEGLALAVEGDFVAPRSDCVALLPRGEGCSVELAFKPSAPGTRRGALLITLAGTPTAVRITLQGEGLDRPPAVAQVFPARLDFAPLVAGHAGAQRTVRLFNNSAQPLAMHAISISAADFVLTGGTCTAQLVLQAQQACTIALRMDPLAAGARQGSLRIEHDGVGGESIVVLAGLGLAGPAPAIGADLHALNFGVLPVAARSPMQWVELSNTGNAPLQWQDISTNHTDFMLDRSGCPQALPLLPGQRCRVGVSFQPVRAVAVSAELVASAQGAAAPLKLVLFGAAGAAGAAVVPTVTPTITPASTDRAKGWINASSIEFSDQMRGLISEQDVRFVRINNRGDAPLDIGGIQLVGDHAADFSWVADCAAGTALPAGAVCKLALRFAPRAVGLRQATFRFADASISLQGRGWAALPDSLPRAPVAAAGSALTWQSAPLPTHAATGVGEPPATVALMLDNRSPVPMQALQWSINGPALHDFNLDATSTCRNGMTLAAGASCVARVRFQPTAPGQRNASLVAFAADGVVAQTALQGVVSAPPIGMALVQPEAVVFVASPEQRSGRQTVLVENVGSAVLRVASIDSQNAAFSLHRPVDGACPAEAFDLMPGDYCRLEVAWAGATAASQGGLLLLTTDSGASVKVALSVSEDPALRSNQGTGGGALGGECLLLLAWAGSAIARSRTKSRHA